MLSFLFGGLFAKIITIVTVVSVAVGTGKIVGVVNDVAKNPEAVKGVMEILEQFDDSYSDDENYADTEGIVEEVLDDENEAEAASEEVEEAVDTSEEEAAKKEEEEKKKAEEAEKAAKEKAEKEAEEAEKKAEEAAKALEEANKEAEAAAQKAQKAVENAAGGKVEISRQYYEDCGSDTGYWEVIYSDGTVEYIDD